MADGVILIADDDENDVLLLKRALNASKIRNPVRVAKNGEEAIQYLAGEGIYADREAHPFPILLALNLQMPRRNGSEVLAWLQVHQQLPPVRVIIISGFDEAKQAKQVLHLGAGTFIRKPPSPEELMAELQRMHGLKVIEEQDGIRLDLAA